MSKSEAPEMYAHFKNMDCNINIDTVIVTCSIIYRPPPYKQNGFRNSLLFEEWSKYLDNIDIMLL